MNFIYGHNVLEYSRKQRISGFIAVFLYMINKKVLKNLKIEKIVSLKLKFGTVIVERERERERERVIIAINTVVYIDLQTKFLLLSEYFFPKGVFIILLNLRKIQMNYLIRKIKV